MADSNTRLKRAGFYRAHPQLPDLTEFRHLNAKVGRLVTAEQKSFCGPSPKNWLQHKSIQKSQKTRIHI